MILNTIHHPFSTSSILDWMLREWQDRPSQPLMVVVPKGVGTKMNTRIRVKVSKLRSSLTSAGHDDYIQFGFHSTVIPWSADNEDQEALCLNRVRTGRHKALEVLARSPLKDLLNAPLRK